MDRQKLTEKHDFVSSTIFRLKILILIGKRMIRNLLFPVKKFKNSDLLADEPVIAFSESDLWNLSDNKENRILTAGKIENLRIASKRLNGIEINRGEVFSFWKHIGNPNFGQGYVTGREIREGCIVPSIGGGLCQLSNALYDAAMKADFAILERHRHTKVVPGSLAEQNRDATVKWNYIDLRFKSTYDFRIEAELTSDKLLVRLKSRQKNTKDKNETFAVSQPDMLNDCYSCGNTACFSHRKENKSKPNQESGTTTFILDEYWPEYDKYIHAIAQSTDHFLVPLSKNSFIRSGRYAWEALYPAQTRSIYMQAAYRALKLRYASGSNVNFFELNLQLDKKIAQGLTRLIPVGSSHLVISQNLLPFVYETGALGGRTYDVLMTRLPLQELHKRLDDVYSLYPESRTLGDFRASDQLVELENIALIKARKIISVNNEIADIYKHKAEKLNWHIPAIQKHRQKGTKILFPASAVGRKGAYEMKRLAKELNMDLTVSGQALEREDFWEDIKTERFNGDFNEIGLVVYPTYIEHQPRMILKAIAFDIPVITTTACGISESDRIILVEMNNYDQLKKNVIRQIRQNTFSAEAEKADQ